MDITTLLLKMDESTRNRVVSKLNHITSLKFPGVPENPSLDDVLKLLGYCSIRKKLHENLEERIRRYLDTTVVFFPKEITDLRSLIREQYDKAVELALLKLKETT